MGAATAADLRNWQLFSYLSASDLTRLAGIADQQRYRKGETIFSEGGEAGYFLVLLKGQVKIFKLAPDGREQILRVVRAGESFGEAAALAGGALSGPGISGGPGREPTPCAQPDRRYVRVAPRLRLPGRRSLAPRRIGPPRLVPPRRVGVIGG